MTLKTLLVYVAGGGGGGILSCTFPCMISFLYARTFFELLAVHDFYSIFPCMTLPNYVSNGQSLRAQGIVFRA